MKNRLSLQTPMVLALCLALPGDAAAAKLKPETLQSWETYVQLTEKRIGAELDSASGFLRTDYVKPAEAATIRGVLKNGRVHIEKLRTPGADGREIRVADGLIHHWFGSILCPEDERGVRPEMGEELRDEHHRYFQEVEQSKLLSRDGDTYTDIPPVRAQESSDRSLQRRPHGRLPASSGRKGIEPQFHDPDCRDSERRRTSEIEKPVGDDSGYLCGA